MLIDITRTLGLDAVTWPGDHALAIRPALSIDGGDAVNLTRIEMTNHAGTHLDAPLHMLAGGKTLDDFPIERLRLPARVVEIPAERKMIGPEDLASTPLSPDEAILFKTANGALPRDRFYEDYVAISVEAAQILARARVPLVGLDYLSVDSFTAADHPAHCALLGAEILLLEDADLRGVAPGRYVLWCFPLKLHRANGAPCRAVLEQEKSEGCRV